MAREERHIKTAKAIFTFLSSFLHVLFGGWAPCCRFTPSCSQYAAQAVTEYGWLKGLVLAGRRIWRCRPGASWGSDPVVSDNLVSHQHVRSLR